MPGRRLCLEEHEEIRVGIVRGEPTRQIGGRLSRHHATIAREVAAGGGREVYGATAAQRRADAGACRPKPFKLAADRDLADRVTALVHDTRYSPPVGARLLAKEGLRVSGETIYQACYQPGRGLAFDLWMRLPRAAATPQTRRTGVGSDQRQPAR